MDNYPIGAANDPRAPYNEPEIPTRRIIVEAGIELGTIVEVDVEGIIEDGEFIVDEDDLNYKTDKAIAEKIKADGRDVVINDLFIYNKQFK